LGQEALAKYRTGDIRTLRGTIFRCNDQLYLPTFTPQDSYDRKNYENPENADAKEDEDNEEAGAKDIVKTRRKNYKFWLYNDVRKALRIVQFGIRNYPRVDYKIHRPAEEITKALKTTKHHNLVVDIETDKNLNITCFGFCFYEGDELRSGSPVTVYVVPSKRYFGAFAYSRDEIVSILQGLAIAMRDNKVIGHNLSFDLFVLAAKYLIPFPQSVFDTMIGHHRLFPEVEKSLGHVVSYYTDLPFHKDEGIFDPKNSAQEEQLWSYNGKDVATTLFVYLGMLPELMKAKALESALQGCASLRPYLTMSYEGCRQDLPKTIYKIDDYNRRYNQLERILGILTKRSLNPRSPKQVSHYLYATLRLPEPEFDKTGEANLHKLYIKCGAPSIRVILEMRGIGTLRSKLSKTLLWRNQRLTCSYKVTGSDMHRLGSSALLKFKPFKGYGANMQNYHKSIRDIVIPDPGMILGQTDQAGADAKIVSYLCVNDKFRSLFLTGIKPHIFVAMQLVPEYWAERLGISSLDDYIFASIAQLKSLPHWHDLSTLIADSDNAPDPQHRYYYIAKQMCHSLNYGASWAMFQLIALKKSDGVLRLSNEVCKKYHNLYRNQIFTEISTWHQEVQETAQRGGRILKNLYGYPRQFGGFWGDELFKQMYAFIPQSTVACITHHCAIHVQSRIDSCDPIFEGVSLLQNGHDSLLWQAPKGNWKRVGLEIKKAMEAKLKNFRGENFQMGSGTSIGENWGPKDSTKNPLGLEELKGAWWE
jgi:DNA polymerase I-like protein with 3'-5' exonuclease and polymerase domains